VKLCFTAAQHKSTCVVLFFKLSIMLIHSLTITLWLTSVMLYCNKLVRLQLKILYIYQF
jgi:hypothetical protein